jgi:4-phosphopantoate--beta-alanine ligase
MNKGIVHETGLIAHGRGEAFDYLLGEKTPAMVELAEKVAAAALLSARNPVISVNGNVAALCAKEVVSLADSIPSKIEVNLFHRSKERVEKIIDLLYENGAKKVYGGAADAQIPGISHDRSFCDSEGIFSADVVLVPLEDGDRCLALRSMNKMVIAIDLNPLSRTAKAANISVVDNVMRALPNIEKWVLRFKKVSNEELSGYITDWNNDKMLDDILNLLTKRLNSLF